MPIELLRRKKGIVYRAIYSQNCKRISKCFLRKFDALKWMEQKEMLHARGYQGSLGFIEASRTWLQNHSKVKKGPGSYRTDVSMVEKVFVPFFGNLELEKITPERVESLVAALIDRTLTPSTVNRHLQCLRALLNYYVKMRRLHINPVSLVGLLPENEASFDYLSIEEANHFLVYTNQKYETKNRWVYLLYLLAMNTGMRWGEIIALKWDRVDLSRNLIIVSRSYCEASKSIQETTKGRRIRYVGINSALLPELWRHRETCASCQNLVFSLNGKVLDLKNFKRDRFRKDLTEAGLREIRFHDLRHTFASHHVMKGGSLYDLQKLLGHSGIDTTERYAHLSPESFVKSTEVVAIDGGRKVILLEERRAV